MSQSKQMTIGSLMTALIPFDSGEPVCFDFAGLRPVNCSRTGDARRIWRSPQPPTAGRRGI